MRKIAQNAQILYWECIASPPGDCIVMATNAGVCWLGTPGSTVDGGIAWTKSRLPIEQVVQGGTCAPLQQAVDELQRYFAGERVEFSCALDLHGTPFQHQVWQALSCIPYGETRSYGDIAKAIGSAKAVRAVGAANGANPIAIIVPCHRVIGSNGALTGYGGGLPTKSWLLGLEGVTLL